MNIGKLYAFLIECSDGVTQSEDLIDHLKRTSEFISEAAGGKALTHLSRISGVSEEILLEVLTTAGALHDIGKAFYQNNFYHYHKDGKTRCRTLTFPGHEVISAYILNKMWNELIISWENELANVFGLALTAVLYHHHPMNVKLRKEKAVKILKQHSEEYNTEYIIEGLKPLVGHLSLRVKDLYIKALEEGIPALTKKGASELNEFYREASTKLFREHGASLNVGGGIVPYALATSILVVADYAAASTRENPFSLFSSVVAEFRKYYFKRGIRT